jgi:competence protein ComEA
MKIAVREITLLAVFGVGFGLTVATQASSTGSDQKSGQSSQRGQTSKDEHPRLPPGDGRDVMIRVCSQCHSPDSAADQQLGPDGWQDLVNQMAETGAQATPEEFDLIVQYLVKAFPLSK